MMAAMVSLGARRRRPSWTGAALMNCRVFLGNRLAKTGSGSPTLTVWTRYQTNPSAAMSSTISFTDTRQEKVAISNSRRGAAEDTSTLGSLLQSTFRTFTMETTTAIAAIDYDIVLSGLAYEAFILALKGLGQ